MIKILTFSLLLVSSVSAQNLKQVDYKGKEIDSQSGTASLKGTSLSEADSKKLMEQIEIIKKRQVESQKILDELDQDE